LRAVQENRLAIAATAGAEQYDAALAAMARLMSEMKRRGLVSDYQFVNDRVLQATLEHVARERYSRSVSEIQRLSSEGEPAALYQMGVLLDIAKEADASQRYLAKAAEAGDAQGQFALALALFGAEDQQSPGREREAFRWLKVAADQGHGQARKALNGLLRSMPSLTIQGAVLDARRWIQAQHTVPRSHDGAPAIASDGAPRRAVQR
jgi:TPR repeat protein